MGTDPSTQRILDDEHLRLLALFHYISGGLTILFSSVFIVHLTLIGFLKSSPELFGVAPGTGPDPTAFLTVLFYVFAAFILLGMAFGVAQIVSGRCLARHRRRTFSLVVAIPNLLLLPYGTILGVLTLMVLGRESIKRLYAEASS